MNDDILYCKHTRTEEDLCLNCYQNIKEED